MTETANPKMAGPIDLHVGRRIRGRRLLLGLSQTDLAEGLQVTFQQVQKYEKGINRVGASRLQRTAEILGVPVAYFFGDMTELADASPSRGDSSSHELTHFLTSDEGLELNRAFGRVVDGKIRKQVVALVKALATGTERT